MSNFSRFNESLLKINASHLIFKNSLKAPFLVDAQVDLSKHHQSLESLLLLSSNEDTNTNLIQFASLPERKSVLFYDAMALCILTGIGLFGNSLTILSILSRKTLRKVINMFLLHHCLINLIQCLLFIPFILALLNESQSLKGCEILGGTFVTMVTANVLNIAAMTACEAYRFEDFLQQNNQNDIENIIFKKNSYKTCDNDLIETTISFNKKSSKQSLKPSLKEDSTKNNNNNNSTASYACVIFGLIMIWLSSIILHLGITLIGSDSKQFYNHAIRNCFFTIGDRQTYILYIMWILLTAVSLALTLIYVKKIYQDVSTRKKLNAKFFITAPSFYQKQLTKRAESPMLGHSNNTHGFDQKMKKNHQLSKSSSLSYSNLNRNYEEMSRVKHSVHFAMKHDRYYYYSHSASDLSNVNKPYFYNNGQRSNVRCASFLFGVNDEGSEKTTCSTRNLIGLFKKEKENSKRRYDFIKQILQRIKIQFIVIKLFILCWIPLFFTVAIDAKFEVSPAVYRYLTLIAFANSSLTPYCYLTILVPRINKYCLPCLRTDGRQSKKKTAFYDAMEKYYEKLGDRFHNLSAESSFSVANESGENAERVSRFTSRNEYLNRYRNNSLPTEASRAARSFSMRHDYENRHCPTTSQKNCELNTIRSANYAGKVRGGQNNSISRLNNQGLLTNIRN